jgi:predicted dehydrogenase
VTRLGIVGCNFGRTVLLPAFRADPRCQVTALAGTDDARTADLAREAGIAKPYGDWTALIDDPDIDAVAIAVPPRQQPAIALRALSVGKPVFADKPLAASVADARAVAEQATASGKPAVIDFEFAEIPVWRRARQLINDGALGQLRHVMVTWNTENRAVQLRLQSWKTMDRDGGGVLANFISHNLYYLEWFCGPIDALSARLFPLPGSEPPMDTTVTMSFGFSNGAAGSLAVSCASFLGSGHKIEFYGDDGSLVLANPTADYMRGFKLWHARRHAAALERIGIDDPLDAQFPDGRIAPVSRLASRFLDAIERGGQPSPSLQDGVRVQELIEAARRSHASGCWVDVAPAEPSR